MDNSREIQPINFYLSSLEEQARCELKDSEATLTQCESEGKVHLIIQEDLLATLLDQLQQQREGSSWGHEKEVMQREICDLKVQLAERVPSPPSETEYLKSQLGNISNRLLKAQKNLELQYFITEDLKVELEQMKGEKEALTKEVENQKMELCKEKQKLKVRKTNVELERFLEMERAQAQELKDKLCKMEEALLEQEKEAKEIWERSKAFHRAQLDEAPAERVHSPPGETERLRSQLEKAQKDLDLQTFITEALKVDLKQMKGEMQALKNIVATQKLKRREERQMLTVGETTNVILESHLEMERAQAQELKDKLSKVEEVLLKQDEEAKEILERSQASHRAQLEMQDQNNKKLMDALEKKYEHQLESHFRIDSTLRSQLVDLQSRIMQKPKKKKWYKKLLPG